MKFFPKILIIINVLFESVRVQHCSSTHAYLFAIIQDATESCCRLLRKSKIPPLSGNVRAKAHRVLLFTV